MIKMQVDIRIEIPEIWGVNQFHKNIWADINYFVGQNGTGKSLFALQLNEKLKQINLKVKFLNSERLSGLERENYSDFSSSNFSSGLNLSRKSKITRYGEQFGLSADAFLILREHLEVRIKIEALLTSFFQKEIKLIEEGGFLIPKMINRIDNTEYNFKEKECHGLKEIITILTFLYYDKYNCIIIDEPEMHLHPQFQLFLLNEFKKVAGNPRENPEKKIIFIITHSSYFVDLKDLNDLKKILIFHSIEKKMLPTYIENFDDFDTYERNQMRRFFAKFNTHHKQLFFANNPLFVEGYTDKQIISILLEKLEKNVGARGSCIIEVGGKGHLAIFYKLLKKLKIEARFIADLDILFEGKMIQHIKNGSVFQEYMSTNGIDPSLAIGNLWRLLDDIRIEFLRNTCLDSELSQIKATLETYNTSDDLKKQRYALLLGIDKHKAKIKQFLPNKISEIEQILGVFEKLIKGCAKSKVFILRKGVLENYYINSTINYLERGGNKEHYYEREYDYIINSDNIPEINANYLDLLKILMDALPLMDIDYKKFMKRALLEWFQKLQRLVNEGEIKTEVELKNHHELEYQIYNQLFELLSFSYLDDGKFECKILVSQKIISEENTIEANHNTVPNTFWN